MTREAEVRGAVRQLAARLLEVDEAELDDAGDWEAGLGGDSLQRLELLSLVEDRFGIRFSVEAGAAMSTIDAVVVGTLAQLGAANGGPRRVVVTGLGVVSPLGLGVEVFWDGLIEGRVATRSLRRLDTRGLLSDQGGEVPDFRPADFMAADLAASGSLAAQYATAATGMALADAGLLDEPERRRATGVCFGSVMGGRPMVERWLARPEPDAPVPGAWALQDVASVCRLPALAHGLGGPRMAIPTACAAGNSAIAYAFDAVRQGRAGAMVAGGAEELAHAMLLMFNSFRALAPDCVRPFDRDRQGMLLAEGAAALLLEPYEAAVARGAAIYGEVLGHANFCDAHHMTAPHPAGAGAIRTMRAAVEAAGLRPEDVDYVSAHGTGTRLNDAVESRAIQEVFGAEAASLPVSSIKGALGHAQGAAAAMEAVGCLLTLRRRAIPPTANHRTADPDCPVALVVGGPLQRDVGVALNNSFGFGGNISCVVFGAVR
jgi:3-oxoacyl-(acyl-carrier-protein) synthase/acyl carrier protein